MAVRYLAIRIPAKCYRLPVVAGAALLAADPLDQSHRHDSLTTLYRLMEGASALLILGCAMADQVTAWRLPKLLQ